MAFWFLDETPPETPGLGGYSYGLIDDRNPAPKGATVLEDQSGLDKLIDSAAKNFDKAIDAVEPVIECPVKIPEGVRWHQPEKGQSLTYAFRSDLSSGDKTWLIQCWAEFVSWAETDTNLRFVEARQNQANIVIGIRDIDGSGQVLAEAVTRVVTRQERIVSGELFFDSADLLNTLQRDATHLHEGCHIIGIPHSPGRSGLMAAIANSVREFGEYENTEKFKRYPKQKLA